MVWGSAAPFSSLLGRELYKESCKEYKVEAAKWSLVSWLLKPWNGLPRGVVITPALEVFNSNWRGLWENCRGVATRWSLSFSNPNHSMIPWRKTLPMSLVTDFGYSKSVIHNIVGQIKLFEILLFHYFLGNNGRMQRFFKLYVSNGVHNSFFHFLCHTFLTGTLF